MTTRNTRPTASRRLRLMTTLWPAFLMAGVLEMLVFALLDPANLHWFGGEQVALSASAVYTLVFFVFWGVIATAGALTQLLNLSADDINHQPVRRGAWPR